MEGLESYHRAVVVIGFISGAHRSSGLVPWAWERGSGEFCFSPYQLGVQSC